MDVELRGVDGGVGRVITITGEMTEKDFFEAFGRHFLQDEQKFRRYRFVVTDYCGVTAWGLTGSTFSE